MKLFLHVLLLLHVSLNHSISAPSLTDARAEFFIQVELNNIGFVQNWLNQGGNINVQSHDGKTALMRASQRGHQNIVLFLIKNKARINIRERKSQKNTRNTALDLAIFCGHKKTIKTLTKKNNKNNKNSRKSK